MAGKEGSYKPGEYAGKGSECGKASDNGKWGTPAQGSSKSKTGGTSSMAEGGTRGKAK
jgi:hypothetical protein